ncbi:TPA: hypothetical protein MHS14_23380 [Klebsiella pneumoniae]|nr:hypothetical protein [Klebsiella pneumoniae]
MIRTKLQTVSISSGFAGKVFAQLPTDIVIIHTPNALFYIAGFPSDFLNSVLRPRHVDCFFFATLVSTSVHQLM